MIAEVISIGDELTSGQRLDTNSRWLSQQLGELGIRVIMHTTVADDLAANIDAFRDAAGRADVVLCTGGLGPTADDLTREALAAAMGVSLQLDEAALDHVRSLFARHRRKMPENNRVQAMFPTGSRVIPNPHGTAPGIAAKLPSSDDKSCHVYALPGVPAEMREMWRETVADDVQALSGNRRVIHHHRIKCFGAGESHIEQMLPDLIRRGRRPSVGITASEATITLRITATGETLADCQRLIEPTVQTIRDCLGTLVFGEEDEELEHVIARLLAAQDRSLATVEAGTNGIIAGRLRSAGGGHYLGGLVVNDGVHAAKLLGSTALSLMKGETASGDTVASWAADCLRQTGADLALAVGPFPGPEQPSEQSDKTHIALATDGNVDVRAVSLAGHPAIRQPRVAKEALNWVRLALSGQN